MIVSGEDLGKLIIDSNHYTFIKSAAADDYATFLLFPDAGTYKLSKLMHFYYLFGNIELQNPGKSVIKEATFEKRNNNLFISIDDIEYVFSGKRQ